MTMLSVIIPAYNEEDSIEEVMQRVLAIRPELPAAGVDDLELIVVNDGSRDRTAELVQATPGVRLLTHVHNGGYGAALKTGFAAARGELIGFLDADGTYPPEKFPDLCRAAAGARRGYRHRLPHGRRGQRDAAGPPDRQLHFRQPGQPGQRTTDHRLGQRDARLQEVDTRTHLSPARWAEPDTCDEHPRPA